MAPTVLIIDDDPYSRSTLQLILEEEGYAVVAVEDGEMGLAAFRERSPDLVITDLIMPTKEGLETIREIRRSGAATPIIAVSGGGRIKATDLLVLAEGLGANAVLAKPFDESELLDTVRGQLGLDKP